MYRNPPSWSFKTKIQYNKQRREQTNLSKRYFGTGWRASVSHSHTHVDDEYEAMKPKFQTDAVSISIFHLSRIILQLDHHHHDDDEEEALPYVHPDRRVSSFYSEQSICFSKKGCSGDTFGFSSTRDCPCRGRASRSVRCRVSILYIVLV